MDDAVKTLREAFRVLKSGGALVIGFIDRTSKLGQHYQAYQAESVFYRDVIFYSAAEIEHLLQAAGFIEPVWVQTLMKTPEETHDIEPLCVGYGRGAFVVVRVSRP